MLSPASFRNYLFSVCGFTSGDSIFVGVSGGIDSVVLCELLKQNEIPFAMAHVNFGLRGEESDADEKFVADLAKKYQVPFYLKKCSESDFSETGENSVQVAARKIRYAFFDFISTTQGFSTIATAHHLDDSIETALLNFARGTGVAGLRSIQPRHDKLIRPLLFANRNEILEYAHAQKISWREDSSNETDNYGRNRFRHHLLPWLMSEIPQGYAGFESSFSKLSETEKFIEASLAFWKTKCCEISNGEIRISVAEMLHFPTPELFLKFFLLDYGFTDAQLSSFSNFYLMDGNPTAQLRSPTFRLIRHRTNNDLFLIPLTASEKNSPETHFHFVEEKFNGQIIHDEFSAMVDAKKIQLPFHVRVWQAGDKMIPFGMKGHRNVSDILNDLKLPLHKKEIVPVVLSGEEIVWIPGYRIADPFKVTAETQTVVKLSYHP